MRLEISGIGIVTGFTSIEVRVKSDTSFTLKLTPDVGSCLTSTIHVKVCKDPPRIHSFASSTKLLADATPVRLSWTVTGADRLAIEGIGDVTGRSHIEVHPRRDTRYTLVATSPFGQVAKSTVDVQVSRKPPTIIEFRSDREFLNDSTPVELSWSVSGEAHEIFIEGVGAVARSGRVRVRQRRNTVYVLRATSVFGYASESRLCVRVSDTPPRIERFSANPLFVREGMETEIQWKIDGAEEVRIDPKIGSVPPEGRVTVRLGREAEFVIIAKSYFGATSAGALSIRLLKATALGCNSTTRPEAATHLAFQRHTRLGDRNVTLLGTSRTELRAPKGSGRGDKGIRVH